MTVETNETEKKTKTTRKEKRPDLPGVDTIVTLAEEGPENITPLGAVVYVGPAMKTIPQFAVFSNGLPKALENAKADCPAIHGLIVPTSRLNDVTIALKRTGSKESILFKKVQNYLGSED